ncbi:exodeoxyribonuclease VII small subunit [Aquabacter spiritensis]|uniref:Exodeoxyribonuclease 7 small subunit n=1 Tax=Aquabacter spiritensis TaxID=933073 RepID=A0A4R3M446_9HYPH|nr:exodeoxyribonuclease VII small subunit [Aquabacter spiritensis]TCT07586.1 exodeoxyribonuclease VII small subunit [Aquabacter spiritensis]
MAEPARSAPKETAKDTAPARPDVTSLSFEAALAELEAIVQRLERGDVPLEESIAIYERGEALKARCETLLKDAEARVEMITRDADGRPTGTAPLDPAG